MPQDWTAEVVAKMHTHRITGKCLAKMTGYSPEYISMVLNGHRDTKEAREKIEIALKEAEERR